MTMEEWETFPVQFEKSTSTKEKALYKVLKSYSDIVCEQIQVRASPYAFAPKTISQYLLRLHYKKQPGKHK